jgi:hypothetical protein
MSFKKGSTQEGIAVKKINDSFAILLGKTDEESKNQRAKPIFLCSKNSPKIQKGRIFSAKHEERLIPNSEEKNIFICANGYCGPNKKKHSQALIRICTFYPWYNGDQTAHFGGDWSISKGWPKILASASDPENYGGWSDDLVLMSPGDIINVVYHQIQMKSFYIICNEDGSVESHDSEYFIRDLNQRRPRNKNERDVMRRFKKAKCQSTFSEHDMKLWKR